MGQRCEHPLHLGDYSPWQQMAVARKNTSVTYIRIGTDLEVYGPMVFPCRVSNTPRFVRNSVVCTGVYWSVYSSFHAVLISVCPVYSGKKLQNPVCISSTQV